MKNYYSKLIRLQSYGKAALLSFAVISTVPACEDGDSSAQSNDVNIIPNVETSRVVQQTLPIMLPVPGTVVSKDRLKVASRITGFIENIMVDEGDIVKTGDVLVEIDNAQVEAAIKGADAAVLAAKADLLDAKSDIKRIRNLVQSKTIAEDNLRNAEVRQAQTEATLAIAEAEAIAKRQERRYSHIVSPSHAQVRERHRDPGDLATAGESILQLDVLGAMELEIYLPSTTIGKVSIGQTVNVQFESYEGLLESKITSIVNAADEVTRRYKVRLLLPPNKNFSPGQFGQAQIILREETVTVIPVSAVTERAGIEGVFITDTSNTVHFRSIRLGKSWQGLREVLAGIEPDTLIVSNPSLGLRDGDVIR